MDVEDENVAPSPVLITRQPPPSAITANVTRSFVKAGNRVVDVDDENVGPSPELITRRPPPPPAPSVPLRPRSIGPTPPPPGWKPSYSAPPPSDSSSSALSSASWDSNKRLATLGPLRRPHVSLSQDSEDSELDVDDENSFKPPMRYLTNPDEVASCVYRAPLMPRVVFGLENLGATLRRLCVSVTISKLPCHVCIFYRKKTGAI